MTGWRLGWMTHPPSIRVIPTLAMMVQYTSSGVTTFLQHAGVAAIRDGELFGGLDARLLRERHGHCLRRAGEAATGADGAAGRRPACTPISRSTACRTAARPASISWPGPASASRPASSSARAPETFSSEACVCRKPEVLTTAMERLSEALRPSNRSSAGSAATLSLKGRVGQITASSGCSPAAPARQSSRCCRGLPHADDPRSGTARQRGL